MAEWERAYWCVPYRDSFNGSTEIYGRLNEKPERLSDAQRFDLLVSLQIDLEEAEADIINIERQHLSLEGIPELDEEIMTYEERELSTKFDATQSRRLREQDPEALTHEERIMEIKIVQRYLGGLLEKKTYQKLNLLVAESEHQMAISEIPSFEEWKAEGNRADFKELFAVLGLVNEASAIASEKQLSIPKRFESLQCRLVDVQLRWIEGRRRLREFEYGIPGIAPLNFQHYQEIGTAEYQAASGLRYADTRGKRKPAPPRNKVNIGRDDTGQAVLPSLKHGDPETPVGSRDFAIRPLPSALAQSKPQSNRNASFSFTSDKSTGIGRSESLTPKLAGRISRSTAKHFHESGDCATGTRNPFTRPTASKDPSLDTSLANTLSDLLRMTEGWNKNEPDA